MIPMPRTATPALQGFVVNTMRSVYALVAAFAKYFRHKPEPSVLQDDRTPGMEAGTWKRERFVSLVA
jgi:hypothetical protein